MKKTISLKNKNLILQFFLFSFILLSAPLHASGGDSFLTSGLAIIIETYEQAKTSIYFVTGIAIIVLAVLAFFGRFGWTKFFSICGGVFLVAMTDELMSFLYMNSSGTSSAGLY